MDKIELLMDYCSTCHHFDFCLIHWGADCKRHGGKKIPRLRTTTAEERKKISQRQSAKKLPKHPVTQMSEIFEPIRTKAVHW